MTAWALLSVLPWVAASALGGRRASFPSRGPRSFGWTPRWAPGDTRAHVAVAAAAGITALGTGGGDGDAARATAELRDRYATLVVTGHDRSRAVVAALSSYREAEAMVPSLGGSGGGARAPKAPRGANVHRCFPRRNGRTPPTHPRFPSSHKE